MQSEVASEGLFHNQAFTHTLSDWLIPAVFQRDQKTTEEFIIGLPDLSDLIDRTDGKLQINWPFWRECVQSRLTPLGQNLKRWMVGKTFYDLACGDPVYSVAPRLLAQSFGASDYVGVDLKNVEDAIYHHEFPALGAFQQRRSKRDALSFLKDQILLSPACVLIAGLEAVNENQAQTSAYLQSMAYEIEQKTRKGDLLILGAGTSQIRFSPRAFRSIYSDHYHEVFERRGKFLFIN